MWGTGRRRSTSEGDGDRLSSTLNLPEATRFNRFDDIDSNRYASTPHVNITGFIDDNLESGRGTQFESRVRTRSRPISNTIDAKLRDDFTQLKDEIIKWGELACSIPQTMDVIEIKHKAFFGNIELKISEVLVTKGNLVLVGELGNLKDRLNWIRKRAKQVSRESSGLPQQQDEHIPVRELGEEYHDMMIRSCDLGYVFHNEEPIERSSPYSVVSAPIYRGGETQSESRSNGAMVGSRSVTSELGSTRPNLIRDSHTHNTPGRSEVGARDDYGVPRRSNAVGVGSTGSVQPGTIPLCQGMENDLQPDGVRFRNTGVGGIESVPSESIQPSLNTPRVLQPEGARTRRVLEWDQNGSLDEVISRFSARGLSTDGQAESGTGLRRQNQNSLEEKINNLIKGMSKFSTTMQGTEAMYQELQERVRVLEASNSKVWDRLDAGDQRLKRLSSILEHQGNACKLHLEIDSLDRESTAALDEGEANQGSYDGNVVVNAVECNSPNRDLNTVLGRHTDEGDYGVIRGADSAVKTEDVMNNEDSTKQGVYTGSVVVNAVECNSPNCGLSTALDRNTSEDGYGVFKAKVPIAKFRNDEGLDCTKSTETDTFSVTLAKTGRGVAELLMDPVSQSWRAKPNQKEFLIKIDEVENFKKNDDGKRNEDFRKDDGLDKADSFKKVNYFRRTEDLEGSDGNFKKNDNPEKNGSPELISSAEIISIREMMRNPEPGKCSAPITEPEVEEEEAGDDSGDISVPFLVLMFRAGRGVAGELLIDPGQRSPGLMRSFVLRSPGLKRFPSLMRSPDLVRSPGLMISPILRSPVLRSTGLMRYPVLRAPILRSPVLRPPDLMRSSDLNRSPGLMRSLVLKADSIYTSPLMSSPVLRSPVLYLYLEKFSDLSGVKELVSRPIIGMKFSILRRFPGLKKFSGLKKSGLERRTWRNLEYKPQFLQLVHRDF